MLYVNIFLGLVFVMFKGSIFLSCLRVRRSFKVKNSVYVKFK